MVFQPPNPKREHSFDQKLSVRIKSAHPLNLDREKLMQENINLKNQLNKMNTEKMNAKREITNLENELLQKEKIIENMINESQMNSNTFAKASEMNLVINVKRQYKDLKKEYEKNIQSLEQAKKDIKNIRLNDLVTENKNLSSQIEKFKNMYYANEEKKNKMQKNVQDINAMKQALNKQDEMLLSFQENCQKMELEILNLNEEIDKLQTQKSKKDDVYNKLKKKLKLQKQLNEKLTIIRDNVQNTEIFCIMKKEYEQKLQKLRKDLAYYRDSNAKNEQLVKEAEKFRQKRLMEEQKQEDLGFVPRRIQASNPSPISENENMSEEEAKKKITLLQNLYMEEKNEVQKLKNTIEELNQKIQNNKMVEPKIILTKSYSATNIKKPLDVIDYAYFSDGDLKEFIYILVKNLEANKIDMSILESRVLNDETLELLKDKNNYKEFITQVGNNLIEILKVKNENDQIDIHSFIKTFLYNNYIALEKQIPEEFKAKLLALFTNINFYSLEQRQELNKIISAKLTNKKDKLIELLYYFDEKENGYISFTKMNKILEKLKISFKNDVKEYFFYVLKSFPDEGNFLKDLKYVNILKILEDTPIECNEQEDGDPEGGEGDEKEKEDKKDNDDDAIEITNEEYLAKVKDIIERICEILINSKKNVDDYFLKIVSKSITDYRAIRLIKLVDVLKKDFKIDLTNIEIFCLFTKVKPNLASSKDADDIEEIIDYDKLKEEIENRLKQPLTKKAKETEKEKANKAVSLSTKPINKEKLNYSDILEHAPYENEKNAKKINFDKILRDFMKKHRFSFERFIFPVHCMMKLTTDGKKFNRYLDLEFFKHFLYQNGIDINSYDLFEFIQDNKLLYNDEKINIDYLKYIIEGKNGKNLKEDEFIMFKQNLEKNEKKLDRPEAAKIRKKNKESKKEENLFDESDSDSVKMIQKEINGDSYQIN